MTPVLARIVARLPGRASVPRVAVSPPDVTIFCQRFQIEVVFVFERCPAQPIGEFGFDSGQVHDF